MSTYEEQVLEKLKENGWTIIFVEGRGLDDSFAYTIGVAENFNHPDFLCFSLPRSAASSFFTTLVDRVRAGEQVALNARVSGLAQGLDLWFRKVAPAEAASYALSAAKFFPRTPLSYVQLIWPDKENRLPWEEGFEPVPCEQQLLETQDVLADPFSWEGMILTYWSEMLSALRTRHLPKQLEGRLPLESALCLPLIGWVLPLAVDTEAQFAATSLRYILRDHERLVGSGFSGWLKAKQDSGVAQYMSGCQQECERAVRDLALLPLDGAIQLAAVRVRLGRLGVLVRGEIDGELYWDFELSEQSIEFLRRHSAGAVSQPSMDVYTFCLPSRLGIEMLSEMGADPLEIAELERPYARAIVTLAQEDRISFSSWQDDAEITRLHVTAGEATQIAIDLFRVEPSKRDARWFNTLDRSLLSGRYVLCQGMEAPSTAAFCYRQLRLAASEEQQTQSLASHAFDALSSGYGLAFHLSSNSEQEPDWKYTPGELGALFQFAKVDASRHRSLNSLFDLQPYNDFGFVSLAAIPRSLQAAIRRALPLPAESEAGISFERDDQHNIFLVQLPEALLASAEDRARCEQTIAWYLPHGFRFRVVSEERKVAECDRLSDQFGGDKSRYALLNYARILHAELATPRALRNDAWTGRVESIFGRGLFALHSLDPVIGPDGFPYLHLCSRVEPYLPLRDTMFLVFSALENGYGFAFDPVGDKAELVLSYGSILSHYACGEFFREPSAPASDAKDAEQRQVLFSQPSNSFLPNATRLVLDSFLRRRVGIENPQMFLVSDPESAYEQSLVLNVFAEDFEDGVVPEWVARRLNWYLPAHYGLLFIPKDSERTKYFEPLVERREE